MTFDDFRRANVDERLREAFQPLDDWCPLEWAGAMCGEAGETANLCKKLRRKGYDAIPSGEMRIALKKEVGDTLIYLDLLAARLGLSLEECARHAFNEVSKRTGSEVRL